MEIFTFKFVMGRSFLLATYILLLSIICNSVIAQSYCTNETPLFTENFGSGLLPSSHPDIITTALTYQATGFLLANGVYRVVNNTFQHPDWHTSNDHTGIADGKMLVINGNGNTFYSHTVNRATGFPAGYYSASLFVMNVTKVNRCVSDILLPSFTFTLEYQASDNSWVSLTGSPLTAPPVQLTVTPTWIRLGSVFTLPATGTFNVQNFRITLNDGFRSSCGIDYAIDDIKIATCPGGGPLPVEFLGISARQKGAGVTINWNTASETNHKYFDVEKSIDGGIHWNLVSTIKTSGNSSMIKKYNAFDSKPVAGINYYRIKQVDMDGDYMYSKTVHVKIDFNKTYASVLTNPIINDIAIDFLSRANQAVVLSLFDMTGKRIATGRWIIPKGYSRKTFDKLKNIQRGMYILSIMEENGSSIYYGKLIKE